MEERQSRKNDPDHAAGDEDAGQKRRKAAAAVLSSAALPAAGILLEADPRTDRTSETEASLKRATKKKGGGRARTKR
jgi:hypothetical protein